MFFCNASGACFIHPSAGVNVINSGTISISNVNLSAGAWQVYVQTSVGPSAKSAPFTVQQSASAQPPTITNQNPDRTPIANQNFNTTITGTNFVVNGTSVFFCMNGTSTCFQHPAAGVNVTSTTNINVSNVNLSAGAWQIYVSTSAGQSAKTSPFNVQLPAQPPTISSFSWDRVPMGGEAFNGTINGLNFVVTGTSVFFCVNGSSSCFQHPSAGVTVNSTSKITVNNVNLNAGSWQIMVQTSVGQSSRSNPFTVVPPPPTISSYSWDRTPTGGQPFNGTINGANFVVNGTSVFFCINGSSTCFQHPRLEDCQQ